MTRIFTEAQLKAKREYNKRLYQLKKEKIAAQGKAYRLVNKDKENKRARKYQQENKVKLELNRILRTYNISLVDYKTLVDNQNNTCFICKENHNKLVVDHCHTTGKVRKLLCVHCNFGLGHFRDNPELLRQAAKYLEYHDNSME